MVDKREYIESSLRKDMTANAVVEKTRTRAMANRYDPGGRG
jgi:hypothetical protein